MKDKLEYLSATELGRAVNRRKLSPKEVVEYFEKRIKERNPSLNAFTYTKFEYAYQQAEALETKLYRDGYIGPFAGVPFALKDFLSSKVGWTHSYGGIRCLIQEDTTNSVFCDAMERMGGIAVGKTNCPAYGFRGTCDNKLYGPTHNPFILKFNSGGSSGGSAAAVADGLVPIAEGGDAGGSIRIPASWCNLVGFKPSVGKIPSVIRPDAWAATHPYCFNGGLTRTVEDTAMLYSYMSYSDSRDPLSLPNLEKFDMRNLDRLSGQSPLKGTRIAVTPDFGMFPTDPKIIRKIEQVGSIFQSLGAEVDYIDIDCGVSLNQLMEVWLRSIQIDTAIQIEQAKEKGVDYFKDYPEDFPAEVVYWTKKAAESSIMDYFEFNTVRTKLYDMQDKLFQKYDLLISPVTACMPVPNTLDYNTSGPSRIGDIPMDPLIGFAETVLFNFTGNPAISLPAGFIDYLPVGFQLVGPIYHDEDILVTARYFEKQYPWGKTYKQAFEREIN